MISIEMAIGVFLVLAVFSLLYKENILYRFAEHTFVGYATAHGAVSAFRYLSGTTLPSMFTGKYYYIIGIILGISVFTRLLPKYAYLSRSSMALIVGTGIGLSIPGVVSLSLLAYIVGATQNLMSINGVLIAVGCITAMTYWIYTIKRIGSFKYIVQVGRYFIMVTLGWAFATQALTRITYTAARIAFLLRAVGL